jgi:hypothetical protein
LNRAQVPNVSNPSIRIALQYSMLTEGKKREKIMIIFPEDDQDIRSAWEYSCEVFS